MRTTKKAISKKRIGKVTKYMLINFELTCSEGLFRVILTECVGPFDSKVDAYNAEAYEGEENGIVLPIQTEDEWLHFASGGA